jgi:hypothetical protein
MESHVLMTMPPDTGDIIGILKIGSPVFCLPWWTNVRAVAQCWRQGLTGGAAHNILWADLNTSPFEGLEMDVQMDGDPAYSTFYFDEATLRKLNVSKGGQ